MTFPKNLWQDEQGQDLIEYTLLMAFVTLVSAAIFIGAGASIKGIWKCHQITPMDAPCAQNCSPVQMPALRSEWQSLSL